MIYTKKLIKYGDSLAIVIPSELIAGLGWQRGNTFVLEPESKDKLIIHHVSDVKILKMINEQQNVIKT